MINLVGNISGSSGYDIHTRELANALFRETKMRLTTQIPAGMEKDLTDREIEMIKTKPQKDEINIIITNPMFWKSHANAKRNWAYLVWEGDKIPKSWISECLNESIEYILVPSKHTKEAILNTAKDLWEVGCRYCGQKETEEIIPNKIKIIPHGVDLDKFFPKEKNQKFTFFANKGLRNMEDRGGIQYLLQAYIQEFNKDDQVELFIKLNPAYGIPNMAQMVKDLGQTANSAPIILSPNLVPHKELNNLYNRANVFVSPTRAESFNIPCLEAMSCGLPVITTNFGGQTDFVNEENGWLIGGELTEIKHELLYEGCSWLTPNIEELRKKLRYVFEHQDEVKSKGEKALETAKKMTWNNSAKLIVNLI